MLIAIDVGNTNITLGMFDGEKLAHTYRLTTKMQRTSDEFGVAMLDFTAHRFVQLEDIEGVIVASVVPNIMHAITGAIERYLKQKPLIVGPGIKTGIKVITENPKAVGADRIVDAVAAFEKYGGPALVIDYGTATTYDLVNEKGEFAAGVTAPGIKICANALWEQTAKLPEVEIVRPASILAQNTITSMQAGLVYGQIGQTEYIINRMREESGYKDLKVIATGGLGSIIADETKSIEIYDRTLTLDGLRMIFEKNRR